MTVDDDNSIYVGKLSSDTTEDSLRHAFDIYGSIIAIKVVNDQNIGGNCYGFVTYANPRSATIAIEEMDGKEVNGRIVKVNEVRTRAGRPNFCDNVRRIGREANWDRETKRGSFRDRDHHRERIIEQSRDHDRERERDYERGRYPDQARDHTFGRGRDVVEHGRERSRDYEHERPRYHDRDLDRDHDMDLDQDKDMDRSNVHDGGRDNIEQKSRNSLNARPVDPRSRELSSDSSGGCDKTKQELEDSNYEQEKLQKEVERIEELIKEKELQVSALKKKSQKLEDSLADAKKMSSQRNIMLKKLQKCFLQSQDYVGKLKSSEQDLQLLVEKSMAEIGDSEDANNGDGSFYMNGQV